MTCRLNFLYSYFLFENTHYKVKCLPGFCAVSFTWSTQFKSLRKIIPKYLQLLASGIFWGSKRVTQWIFNTSTRKSYCLTFTGIYFHPIFYRPSPQGVQILLQFFYVVFICDFSINYTFVGAESNIPVDVPPTVIYVHWKQ